MHFSTPLWPLSILCDAWALHPQLRAQVSWNPRWAFSAAQAKGLDKVAHGILFGWKWWEAMGFGRTQCPDNIDLWIITLYNIHLYIIFYYIILCYIILLYYILYCIILYYIVLYCMGKWRFQSPAHFVSFGMFLSCFFWSLAASKISVPQVMGMIQQIPNQTLPWSNFIFQLNIC